MQCSAKMSNNDTTSTSTSSSDNNYVVGLKDDKRNVSHKTGESRRRSMDFELHDDLENLIQNTNTNTSTSTNINVESHGSLDEEHCHDENRSRSRSIDELIKRTESTRSCDSFSDDDTFAEAESDCEPNQFYLDEMLEDTHPERLNLFDYRRSARSSSRTGLGDENDNDNDNDSYLDQSLHISSSTRFENFNDNNDIDNDSDSDKDSDNDKVVRKEILTADNDSDIERKNKTDDSSSDDEEDAFDSVPKTIEKNRGGRRSSLGSFGSSGGAGPGRPLLRQASQKAVWGK